MSECFLRYVVRAGLCISPLLATLPAAETTQGNVSGNMSWEKQWTGSGSSREARHMKWFLGKKSGTDSPKYFWSSSQMSFESEETGRKPSAGDQRGYTHTHTRTHTHTALVSFFHRLFLNICIMFIISFMLMSWRTTPDRNRVISRNQLLLFDLFGHLVQFITTASDFGSVCFVLFAFCLVRAELWHFYSTTQTEGRGMKWH